VSAPLYHFFCRLELVYWVNLNLRGVGELSVDTMQNISAFAQKDPHVLVAWQRCIERVEEKTATLVCEVATRSECVFEMLAKTYRNVRGKEYTTVNAARNRRTGDVRTSTIRDQLAAGLAVSAKPNKTAVQLRW
jgi:coproporphyrinogen III oxidase-like Fe-S oxidoreductase